MVSKAFALSGERTFKVASFAVAAALLPLFPAVAGAADAGAAASDASEAAPRDPIITAPRRDDLQGPPASDGVVMGPPVSEADELAAGTALYGPPTPKVSKGKLADIAWPDAPSDVPPALETAINIVTRNYPSAKSGRAALRAAAADVKAAKWLWFPSIGGNLEYLNDRDTPQPQLTVEQPLWTGGRLNANIRRAKASEDVESASYVQVVEQLASVTTDTYFQIATLTRREQLLADSLKEHLRLVETMERRVEQEVSPLSDLELARSRSAQVEQDYTATRAQRETALRVLAELVADPNYDLGPVPFYNPQIELANREALEDQSVAFDPQLRRLGAQADVARAEFDSRKASILPQVSAQYSYNDIFGSRVGVVVRAQTTGGLSQVSEINGARLRIQTVTEQRRQAELQLRREIASDIIQYDASKARASISTRASDTAARVSESYMRQFIAGRRSWLDVMNALREAVNAQIGKVDAEQTAMATSVRLLLRSGRWRPSFAGPGQREVEDFGKIKTR